MHSGVEASGGTQHADLLGHHGLQVGPDVGGDHARDADIGHRIGVRPELGGEHLGDPPREDQALEQ